MLLWRSIPWFCCARVSTLVVDLWSALGGDVDCTTEVINAITPWMVDGYFLQICRSCFLVWSMCAQLPIARLHRRLSPFFSICSWLLYFFWSLCVLAVILFSIYTWWCLVTYLVRIWVKLLRSIYGDIASCICVVWIWVDVLLFDLRWHLVKFE